MAQIRGLRLSTILSAPPPRKIVTSHTYDELISALKLTTKPWRSLKSRGNDSITAVRLLFPLNGYIEPMLMLEKDMTYDAFESWITPLLSALADQLLRHYPIAAYHGRLINPLLTNAVVAAFLSNVPYAHALDHLFLVRGNVEDIMDAGITIQNHLWFDRGAIVTPAGQKFVQLTGYNFSSNDPCLFSKQLRCYGLVYYFLNMSDCLTYCWRHLSNSTPLIHFDRPSNGIHCLVPSESTTPIAGSLPVSALSSILLESCLQQSSLNALTPTGSPVVRQVEVLLPLSSPFFERQNTLEYSLFALSNALINGYQFVDLRPGHPDCATVAAVLARLTDFSKGITVIQPRPALFTVNHDSPLTYSGENANFIQRLAYMSGRSIGPVVIGKSVDHAVGWMPQFDPATSYNPDLSLDSLSRATTLPLRAKYSTFWSGPALFSFASCDRHNGVYDIQFMAQFPPTYFSDDDAFSRSRFSSYRAVKDRSLLKDTANLMYISNLSSSHDHRLVPDSKTMIYVGSSGTHADNQPSIIKPLLAGSLPGVFRPLSVKQIGWEVTNGTICDIELPLATGTFFFVYSDVDQVQSGDSDLDASSRRFCSQLDMLMKLTFTGGSLVVKCNFPTNLVWRRIFSTISPYFSSIHLMKPLVSNNLELYLLFAERLPVPDAAFRPSADVVVFWRSQLQRYRVLRDSFSNVPSIGSTLTLDDSLTVSVLNFVDVTSLSSIEDQRALSAFSVLTSLGSQKLSLHPYFDSYRTQLTGIITPHSRNILNRLAYVPRVFPSTIDVQHRVMAASDPEIFGFRSNSWTQLSFFYDATLTATDFTDVKHWLDLGTGPEARPLSFLPTDLPVTLCDTRPFVFPSGCWATFTDFLSYDYLVTNVVLSTGADVVSCILSLGAACADANMTLHEGVRQLISQCVDASVKTLFLQLNCPLPSAGDVSREILELVQTNSTYVFHTLGRIEPFIPYSALLEIVEDLCPGIVVEIKTMDSSLSWLDYAVQSNASVTSDDIVLAMRLSHFCPLFVFHFDRHSAQFPDDARLGAPFTVTLLDYEDTRSYEVTLDNVTIATITAGALVGFSSGVSVTSSNNQLVMTIDPASPGILSVIQVLPARISLGSCVIEAPDPSLSLIFPATLDTSLSGTDLELRLSDWYDVALFYVDEAHSRLLPVSDTKYEIYRKDQAPNSRVINYIFDRSDVFFKLVLCDVSPSGIGRFIYRELPELSSPVWPDDARTFLSIPFESPMVIVSPDGPVNYDGANFTPPTSWLTVDGSTCVIDGRPSFYVPPGRYGLVRV
uniref:Core-spike protein lambda C n=1 Tax=Avian orthoreovirus TaxID=38170 RepID=C8XQ15_9REOV|nr:core-spike protein lambda C [Avian orthoreovirus]